MNQALVMEILVRELTNLLGNIGFVYPGGEYLVRPIPGGRQAIGMAVRESSPDVEFSLLVNVRIDQVESIFHQFSGTPPEYQRLSSTIVTSLNWFEGGPIAHRVRQLEDLQALLTMWREPISVEVVHYLKSAQTVAVLDRLINTERDILDIILPPSCFMHHIIVARLANNPKFDDLVKYHRLEMQDMDYSHELYDRLVEHLTTLPNPTT